MTNRKSKLILIATLLVSTFAPALVGVAHAAPPQFVQAFLRIDRMKATTATGGTICVTTPAAVATEADVQITFPTQTGTDFIVDSNTSHWTVTTTNLPTVGGVSATAWPGIGTATNVTGKTVTFPSGDLAASTLYCFNFSGDAPAATTLTTGSAGNSLYGTIHTRDSGTAIIDETNYALAIISDDQIVVNAVVPPSFVFVLSGNTDTFPVNLDPANIISTPGRTVSITTNAKGGWITWVKDSQQGLYSVDANYTIPSAGAIDGAPTTLLNDGSHEMFQLDTNLTTDAALGCTVGIDPEYDGTGTNQGGTLSANFQPIAACTGAAPATSNGDVITLIERAVIAGGTPAGSDYSDIITVVGAGNF